MLGTLIGAMSGFALPVRAQEAPIEDVMLAEVGPDWTLVEEGFGRGGQFTRSFRSDHANLALTGFAVTTPPGVRTMFQMLSTATGFDSVPEGSLELAAWLVPDGSQLDSDTFGWLAFASRDHFFSATVQTDGTGAVEPLAFLRDLAQRQIEAAGGSPPSEDPATAAVTEAESELIAMLPEAPPDGYGLNFSSTAAGNDEQTTEDAVDSSAADFLDKNSATATRVWVSDTGDLAGAVSITRYPYDIFAAASVHEAPRGDDRELIAEDALPDVPDVVAYRGIGDDTGQYGTAFRRGDVFVIVLTQYTGDVPEETAAALAGELTRLTTNGLPAGSTTPYEFPSAPSKLLGLAFTAAIVTAAACGSALIARLRARTVRRQWVGGERPPPEAGDPAHAGTAIALDDDADRLRRQGGMIAVGQILAVNVGIVALAGDFGWPGVIVAAAALMAGLLLTHWWQRRELGLVGAKAPPRELVIPRPAGAIVGVLSLAVLGLGVAFLLKGLRYIVLKPTLAQLKWSDWFGVAPRTVGVIFAIGGFLVAILGGWLFRLARSLSRAGTRRRLELDPRPAALYLRSFQDDNLPLPVIASARRPLFELFSLRGSDPFEESMAWELNSYGPVVAVGRPGRSLASLGAAREHLPDATWREQVAARMDQAGMIAVATGETDGLAWELGQVVSGGHIGKTFFVFPPVAPAELGRRWDHTAASLERAGQAVGPLPVPPSRIHTVRLDSDGTATVTYASRRDEATYRTAVDRIVTPSVPAPATATAATTDNA